MLLISSYLWELGDTKLSIYGRNVSVPPRTS